jgi:coproporphyrinogen III oxidase-like Fe-S oxidoreductase
MEAMLMGLRLAEGIDLADVASLTGTLAAQLIDDNAVASIEKLGLIRREGQRLAVTPSGMPLLDAILPQVVAVEPEAAV